MKNLIDFSLYELIEDPYLLQGFMPYYVGWNRTEYQTEYPVLGGVGIHHPRGDVKKNCNIQYETKA